MSWCARDIGKGNGKHRTIGKGNRRPTAFDIAAMHAVAPVLQALEPRVMLAVTPPPIDPTAGEDTLLGIINSAPLQQVKNALDNFAVPYAIQTQWFGPPAAGGVAAAAATAPTTIVVNSKSGVPTKIDVDKNKATGRGGYDIEVKLNTIPLPVPQLELIVTRLGGAPFVENFQVLTSFPFSAFYVGPPPVGPQNIFMGYRTLAAGGQAGGHAPAVERMNFIPGNLAGTGHLFDISLNTTGPDNPLLFFLGAFGGTVATGPLNASALGLQLETIAHRVPQQVDIGLTTNASLIATSGTPAINMDFALDWAASERALATFAYVEAEELAVADTDFATTLTVNQMPLNEQFRFQTLPTGGMQLTHLGSSTIDQAIFKQERRDGSRITVDARQVPTDVKLKMAMSVAGDTAIELDVNANTMDMKVEAIQVGGFPGTAGVLPFALGYVSLEVEDAVDLTAGFVAAQPVIDGFVDIDRDSLITPLDTGTLGGTSIVGGLVDLDGDGDVTDDADDSGVLFGFNLLNGRFDTTGDGITDAADDGTISGVLSARATNAGESIKRMDVIADDDAHYEPDPTPADPDAEILIGLQLPPAWDAVPQRHVISFREDGTHGTVAARLLTFKEAVFDLNATTLSQQFHLITSAAAPLQAYLRFGELSNLLPGANEDIELTWDVFDVPAGEVRLNYTPLFNVSYEVIPPQGIDLIHCYGHIGLANVDLAVGDLPASMEFSFNPAGSFSLVAEDGSGGADTVGSLGVRLWETQVAFIDGLLDLNLDGSADADDDGTFLGYPVINGKIDVNEDGVVDADDDGQILGHALIDGKVDVNDIGGVDDADDLPQSATSTGFAGSESLLGEKLRDARIRVDDIPSMHGTWGSVTHIPFEDAPSFRTVSQGAAVYVEGKDVTAIVRTSTASGLIEGTLEVIQLQGADTFAVGDELRVLDRLDFDGQVTPFAVSDVIFGATSGARAVVRRVEQLAGRGTLFLTPLNASDFTDNEVVLVDLDGEGPLTNGLVRAFADGATVSSSWSADVSGDPTVAGMAVDFGSNAENAFLGGVQLALSTAVELETELPEPTADRAHFLHLTDVDHAVGETQTPGRLSLGFFGIDDVAFATVGGIDAEFDADDSRPAQFVIRSGFGGAADPLKAIDVTVDILDVPQQLALSTNMASRFDYTASSDIDSITAAGVIDHKDDGLLNFRIINGFVDLDGDGAITEDDSGHIGGNVVVAGMINISTATDDADGTAVIDAGDDGSIGAVAIVDGLVDVDASGGVDAADDRLPNGTELLFGLVNLPDDIHLRAAPGAVGVTAGLLNLNGDGEIDADDGGDFGGVDVIDGKLDFNGDGVVDEDDDGEHLGRTVIDGLVDLNASGAVAEADTGQWFGVQLNMSGPIDEFELLQRSQSDELAVMSAEDEGNRIMHVQVSDLPANLLLASFGLSFDLEDTSDNGFVFKATDADDNAAPIGSVSLLAATSQDPATISEMRRAFQQTTPGPVGAVLDGTSPSRINYSPYLQAIDSAYYDAGDAEQVLARLESLYAEGAVLDTDNDHVVTRTADKTQILMDVLLRGFQEVSANYKIVKNPIDPTSFHIIDEAELTFRAPFEGTHPFYFGLADSDTDVSAVDDGFFAGRAVIDGRVDINEDGEIDATDNGFAFGHKVIKGEVDVNGDNETDTADDGFVGGIRIRNGRVDVSEQLLSLDIENLPDAIDFNLNYEDEHLSYDADDDVNPSPGDIDVYSGTVTITPDDITAFRLRLFDTPESVDVTWGISLLNGGLNIDGADEFEALLLLQTPLGVDEDDLSRLVGGLRMEDVQIGYDVEFFSFEVKKEFFVPIGDRIINGRIDIDGNGVINNQDDGERDGKAIINGFVDIDGNGEIDGDDDGSILLFQWTGLIPFLETREVIDGGIDQNGNGIVGNGDDYDNRFFVFPTAWELFSATLGIDNNAESTDIEGDPDKSSISGFFNVYQLKSNPVALDASVHTDPPAAQDAEYLPFISTVLDEFRELSYGLDILLEPLDDDIVTFNAGPTLPDGTSFIFDFWVQDLFEFLPPIIDFPDDGDIGGGIVVDFPDDIQTGVRIGRDYTNNSPLHLFPATTFSLGFDDYILTEINLHDFGDHEDPFL